MDGSRIRVRSHPPRWRAAIDDDDDGVGVRRVRRRAYGPLLCTNGVRYARRSGRRVRADVLGTDGARDARRRTARARTRRTVLRVDAAVLYADLARRVWEDRSAP